MSRSTERTSSADMARAMEVRRRQRRRPRSDTPLDRSRDAGEDAAALLASVHQQTITPEETSDRRGTTRRTQPQITPPEISTNDDKRRGNQSARTSTATRNSQPIYTHQTKQPSSATTNDKRRPPTYTAASTSSASLRNEKRLNAAEQQGKIEGSTMDDSPTTVKSPPKIVYHPPRTALRPLLEAIPITAPIFRYGSSIHLIPRSKHFTGISYTKDATVAVVGKRLGRPQELWRFEGPNDDGGWVRFGDTVRVVQAATGHALGCQVNENRNGQQQPVDIVVSEETACWWTIHAASETIVVGRDPPDPVSSRRLPVHMGDPIVLRHTVYHGILTFINQQLELVTDAHGQEVVATPDEDEELIHPNDPPTAMTRLHRAHRLVSMATQMWHIEFKPLLFHASSHLWTAASQRYNVCGKSTAPEEDATLDITLFGPKQKEEPNNSESRETLNDTKVQERILVEELIGACMGLEGHYIQADATRHPLRFTLIDDDVIPFDTIWRSLVHECLEFPAAYAILRRFIAEESCFDRYRQALCEKLAEEMEEHTRTVLVSLDDNRENMSLAELRQTLWQTVRPILTEWVQAVAKPATSAKQHDRLVKSATAPYRQQLREWIESGRLPRHDGIIHRDPQSSWTKRYTWAKDAAMVLPCLADDALSQQVLATGRYWYAIEQCRKSERKNDDKAVDSSSKTVCDLTPVSIQTYYSRASQALMKILFQENEKGLLHTLDLVKGFWLLDYGDVFLEFMNKAHLELLKDGGDVSRNRLQHWMNTCFPDLSPICGLSKDHWIDQHSRRGNTPQRSSPKITGIDLFFIDLSRVPFPVSLILSPKAVDGYQEIFRHLFFARFVKWRLVEVWRDHQGLKPLRGVHLGPTFLLRQRMIHFLENILHYMFTEIIDPQWLKLQSALAKWEDLAVDDVCRIHDEFQETVQEACFLRHHNLARSLLKILKTCLLFADQMHRFRTATAVVTPVPRTPASSSTVPARQRLQETNMARTERHHIWEQRVAHEAKSLSFQRMMARFEQVWSQQLSDFVGHMATAPSSASQHHSSLSIRLDFNGYVTQSLL